MGRKRKQTDTSITSSSEDCQLQSAVPSRIARGELDAMATTASIGIDTTHSSLSLADSSPTSGLDGSLLSAATDQDGCSGSEHQLPVLRNAANERERARMRVLSRAFTRLKTSLPWVPADTKLSKLDTLRLASCYIAHLSRLLAEDDAASCAGGSTVTSSVAVGATPTVAADTTTVTTNDHAVKVKDEKTVSKDGSVTSGKTATSAKTTSGSGVVPAPTTANIHPLSLTWPFSFSSRNGSTIANQCHRSLAQSPLTQVLPSCDVRTITSPSAPVVTSSNGGGKVSKVRGHHVRPQPQALASSV